MSNNPGKKARAGIVRKILAHFSGGIPPVIKAIRLSEIALQMTETDVALANMCAALPGQIVIEMIDLRAAEVAVIPVNSRRAFVVEFNLTPRNETETACSCQEASEAPCFHTLAAAIVLSEILPESGSDLEALLAQPDWRTGINRLLGSRSLARPKALVAKESVALFFSMNQIYGGVEARPFLISDSELPPEAQHDNEAISGYLLSRADDREFIRKIREVRVSDIPRLSLLNPTPLSASLIKSALDQRQMNKVSYRPQRVYFWEGLSDQLVFLGRPDRPIEERVRVISEVLPVEMEIRHSASGLELNPVIRHPDGPVDIISPKVSLFFNEPLWLRSGSTIFRVNLTPESLNQLRLPGLIKVPADGIAEFYDRHLPEIISRLPFGLDDSNITDLPPVSPVPRIYLTEKEQELSVSLRFGYAEHELGAIRKVPLHSFSYLAEGD
ncbi:MAG: hypothetical protein EBZ36_07760, partial [Acidobacteria bacterium]|nr:hypothetical protein [Acidobacteriota bacterium]